MDSENPRSLGSVITRLACTSIGLLLLYALSIGPAYVAGYKFPAADSFLEKLYAPLIWAIPGTPLAQPASAYINWWFGLAGIQRTE